MLKSVISSDAKIRIPLYSRRARRDGICIGGGMGQERESDEDDPKDEGLNNLQGLLLCSSTYSLISLKSSNKWECQICRHFSSFVDNHHEKTFVEKKLANIAL